MHGTITSYSGTTLVMNITDIGGTGTYADWNISISGTQGSGTVTNVTGTTNRITVTNSTTTPVVDIASTYLAAVANGGTGLAALTAHDLIIGNGTSAATLLAPSATSGVPLISQGASSDPAYGTAVVAGGGTGLTTLTANNVILGNGTSAVQFVAPGASGNILTSNGTTWASSTLVATILPFVYPVGSYYLNETDSTNPATLFGFGTWTAVTDVFIVGHGSTYTSTGGAAAITLGSTNLPSFSLNVPTGSTISNALTSSLEAATSNNLGNTTVTFSGSATPFSIIPPYQAAYIWKRTA